MKLCRPPYFVNRQEQNVHRSNANIERERKREINESDYFIKCIWEIRHTQTKTKGKLERLIRRERKTGYLRTIKICDEKKRQL